MQFYVSSVKKSKKRKKFKMKILLGFLTVLIIFFSDQFSKSYIFAKVFQPYGLINNLVLINPTCNTGVAFGLFSGISNFLLPLTLLGVILIFIYLKHLAFDFTLQLSLLIILGGAISNIFDRIILGYVRDFIDLRFWPVFNLADLFIVTGTIILIIKMFLKKDFFR